MIQWFTNPALAAGDDCFCWIEASCGWPISLWDSGLASPDAKPVGC